LHRLRKSHCIRPSGDQAVANSALGSKRFATPGSSSFEPVVLTTAWPH